MATTTDLANLIAARSALILSMSTGEPAVLEFEERGKRVKFESPSETLEALNDAIARCQAEEASSVSGSPRRNRARTCR